MSPRGRAAGIAAILAVLSRLARPGPPESTLEGLATMLGEAAGGTVATSDIAWEPSPGVLTEVFSGRQVLFLARERAGAPRDLYRASVRVSVEGKPISVHRVRNLTATPLGDDLGLVIHGESAAYATATYGKVESVSLLDVGGKGPAAPAPGSILDGAMRAVTNLQETGALAGIGRVDISLDKPGASVKLAFAGPALTIALDDDRTLAVDVATGTLSGDPEATGARVTALPALKKRPILWAVDTVRAEVGPEPIAWLEGTVFGARDDLRRASYAVFGSAGTPSAVAKDDLPAPSPLDASAAGDDGGYWPPRPIPSIWKGGDPEEGTWEPVTYPWLRRLPRWPGGPEPPPYFFRTTVRPDPQRPYAKVLIVAMDMRQLELDMEGGVEDPKPLTGARGAGKIPRDPKILGRVVAAFNGAFKTTHGEYGMMVHKRVLLPPKADAATVVVTEDKKVGLGTWPAKTDIPAEIVSYRQNLEPLIEDGKLSPSGRTQWGWQLAGTSMFTERSGICVTKTGHLYYVWGDEVSASTLGKAMIQAGCTYGMHLDMNPHHTGFVFAAVRDATAKDHDAKLLTQQMEILPERYLEFSPKDFFYVMLREPPSAGEIGWAPDAGAQPAPAWMPGVFRAMVQVAASVGTMPDGTPVDPASVQVELFAFDEGRVDWRVRAGVKELGRTRDPAVGELAGDEAHRVIAAIGLGNGKDPRPLGLATDGKVNVPFRHEGVLVAEPGRGLRVASASDLGEHADAAELPIILDSGKITTAARDHGSMHRRGGVCTTDDGRTILALATYDSDEPTAQALLKAGCSRALSLDRGSHHQTFVHRTGGASPPLNRYEQTVLYAIGRPMSPRAFRWNPPPGGP